MAWMVTALSIQFKFINYILQAPVHFFSFFFVPLGHLKSSFHSLDNICILFVFSRYCFKFLYFRLPLIFSLSVIALDD